MRACVRLCVKLALDIVYTLDLATVKSAAIGAESSKPILRLFVRTCILKSSLFRMGKPYRYACYYVDEM